MGKKKAGLATFTVERQRCLIEPEHPHISIVRQCELLELSRSSYYYEPCSESAENLAIMRRIDEQYLETPFYGPRRMTAYLQAEGHLVNHKRIERLMRSHGNHGDGLGSALPEAALQYSEQGAYRLSVLAEMFRLNVLVRFGVPI